MRLTALEAGFVSGVRVGTRLEQLEALHAKVGQEIAVEKRRLVLEQPRRPLLERSKRGKAKKTAGVGKGSSNILIKQRLEQLGVTAREVKVWALEKGLVDELKRGQVAVDLIDEYEAAHPC